MTLMLLYTFTIYVLISYLLSGEKHKLTLLVNV